ncbi:MAG: hypothetical protein ABIF08_03120 [Nanoarchaeota archaeon]
MPEDFINGNSRKPLNLKIIITALVITVVLFSSGVFTGYSISKGAISIFDSEVKTISNDIENFQLQFLFFDVLGEEATCPLLEDTLNKININSYETGNQIETYGSDKAILDFNEYEELKKRYSRLLVGYWLLSEKMQNACEFNADTIVYFFTGDYTEYNAQGFVLTYLKNKYKEDLLIFSLDGDVDEPSVRALKEYYNIKEYPSLIINGKLYEGQKTSDEIEKILNK